MRPTLLVAVVSDPFLRAALAERLRRGGVQVLDAGGLERRYLRRSGVLLLSEQAMEGAGGRWIEREWRAGRWGRVSVVSIDSPAGAADRLDLLREDWSKRDCAA